jgi:hypothetical protein
MPSILLRLRCDIAAEAIHGGAGVRMVAKKVVDELAGFIGATFLNEDM